MPAIIGRINTPLRDDGTRYQIYFETSIDAVVDPNTGKTVRQLIDEKTYPEASKTQAGLMSTQDKEHLDEIYNQLVVVSEENPGRPCIWYELLKEQGSRFC